MPQPALEVEKYLETPLPALREQYPPGTGGTGPRSEFAGSLKAVQVIDNFSQEASKFLKTLPTEPINPHPAHKYPKFVQAITNVPSVIRSPADLQLALSTLPLAAISSVLTALEADAADITLGPTGAQALDKAGYESDGGEEVETKGQVADDGKTKAWYWQYSKSPMGSGEFLLMQKGSDDVKLVVRTINSAAFTSQDWAEYVVSGPYRYNTKSKASWYWSRAYGATKRLGCTHYVLTDWQRWAFGCFDEKREQGFVSPIFGFDVTEPSILQLLMFWAKTAIGDSNGFKPQPTASASSSDKTDIFPDNPARRVSVSGSKPSKPLDSRKPKTANESDIEESDAEEA